MTIPYLDPILPLQDRQTFLAERYGFTCTCPLCDFQASLPPTVLTQEATPRKLGDMYDEYVARHMDPLRRETPYAPWTAFKPGGPLPVRAKPFLPSRIQMKNVPHDKVSCLRADIVRELTGMFSEGVESEEWELARETGEHVLGVYVVVYGWRHPLVGEPVPFPPTSPYADGFRDASKAFTSSNYPKSALDNPSSTDLKHRKQENDSCVRYRMLRYMHYGRGNAWRPRQP